MCPRGVERSWRATVWAHLWHGHGHSGSPSCWAGPSPCKYTRQHPPAARWSVSTCRCSQTLAACDWRVVVRSFCTTLWSSKGNQWRGSGQKHPVQQWPWCFSWRGCWRGLKRTESEKEICLKIFSAFILTSAEIHLCFGKTNDWLARLRWEKRSCFRVSTLSVMQIKSNKNRKNYQTDHLELFCCCFLPSP